MRLRKTMKRTAAAALALSMALSAAAPAALAKDYYIGDGDITVTVTEAGDTYVRVGEAKNAGDIGEKDDTEVVIKGGKNPDKQAQGESVDTADEAEEQEPVVDAEPEESAEDTGTEVIVWPEDEEDEEAQESDSAEPVEEEPETPDVQEPEEEADAAALEAPTEQEPVEEAADDDDDVMTYEENTASTVTKAVNEAVKHIIKIINNCTGKDTTVTLKDVNIDVSPSGEAALSVEGAGDTTLKLEGDNTLKSGNFHAGVEKNDRTSSGKLTITADSTQDSLLAVGGTMGAGIGATRDSASNLVIEGGTITAIGGYLAAGIGGSYAGIGGSYAGIGGSYAGNGEVTITGNAKVNAEGGNASAGIGGGIYGTGKVTIMDNAEVVAKGGKGSFAGNGAAIGNGGKLDGAKGEEKVDFSGMTGGSVLQIDAQTESGHVHNWTEVSRTDATQDTVGEVEYFCEGCGSTNVRILPVVQPEPEENSSDTAIVLTVTGAPTYEMHPEDTRYIVTADSDSATLSGCLDNLAELKAQGMDTLVFRTQSRETALDIDAMLSLGVDDTLFALTHDGENAKLTVGGFEHNELL